MRVFDWSDHSVGECLVDVVHDVATLEGLPEVPEGTTRSPDEKVVEVGDFDGTPYPIESVVAGWSVFPVNPGQNEGQIILRPPPTPVEGARKDGLE